MNEGELKMKTFHYIHFITIIHKISHFHRTLIIIEFIYHIACVYKENENKQNLRKFLVLELKPFVSFLSHKSMFQLGCILFDLSTIICN